MSLVEQIDTPPDDGNTIDAAPDGVTPPEEALPISKLPPGKQFDVLKGLWRGDADHSREWRVAARHAFAFRSGEQWTAEDRALLDSQQRPHIVFNRVLTILKAVAGMEINGRHEIHFIPRGTEDTAVNEVLSAASRWMADECDGEDEESQAFDQTCTTGMGWCEDRISYEENPECTYVEEMIDCREMYWDRAAKKKNLSDSKRRARVRRMSFGDALELFPGKTRDQLDAVWATDYLGDAELRSIEEKRRRDSDSSMMAYDDSCEVTIVQIQWIEREKYWIVADEETQSKVQLSDREYQRLLARMQALGMQVHAAQLTRKVFKQAFLGGEMLQKAGPAPIAGQFSWKCITGEYDAAKGEWFGLVKVMRDPQMWANKWLSQILHILNTTAKGGILAETDAFDDEREAEDGYARPDVITWVASGALSGEKPKIIPKPGAGSIEGFLGLMTFAISSVKDVTGINLELLGQQDQNQPGIIEAMRKQAGMTVLATLFDSLRRFRKEVGRSRLYFIQTYLSDDRLIRVALGAEDDESLQRSGFKAVKLAKDKTVGKYDVRVDDTPTSPNQKEANWAIIQPLIAVFKEQLMSNPKVLAMLLEYSPLPARIVESIKSFISASQNDPKAQQEREQAKQLQVAGAVAIINKDQSVAELNNKKAGATEATAMYDIAMARNLLAKNDLDGLGQHLDAMQAAAKAEKLNQDAALSGAKAERERVGSRTDLMDAGARQTEAQATASHAHAAAGRERLGAMLDHMAGTTEAGHTLAKTDRERAHAAKLRRPEPRPAAP